MTRPSPLSLALAALLLLAPRPGRADDDQSLPDQTLERIVAHEREIIGDAEKQGDNVDEDSLREQLQTVCHDYEVLLQENPKFAEAYAAYGQLLWRLDMRKESMAMMLKANQIDPDIPFVKNKIGNFLAEQGHPLEAVNYFISAIKLAPNVALYHYNFGLLLYEARDQFLKSGDWTRSQIDNTSHEAFKRAAELAPNEEAYVYRYAESFYDIENPDWNEALKVWSGLEDRATTPVERQTMELQAANVLIKQGKPDYARVLLNAVTDPGLQIQKQKLVVQLDAKK
jgi:tetratricopeptide (TPR) repeat protein